MNTSRVTLPEVARAAGVSTSTAARVLGGYSRVSPDKQSAVLKAAEELGYTPNEIARSLITGRSSSMGLVIGDIENPFFATLARHAITTARETGFDLLVVNTDEDVDAERELVQALLTKRVAGLIIAPASPQTDILDELRMASVPVVTVDGGPPPSDFGAILVDNRDAASKATQLLIDAGHRRIGFIARSERDRAGLASKAFVSPSGSARFEGFLDALSVARISLEPRYYLNGGLDPEDAVTTARLLLQLPEPPTAILCASSVLALGVLRAAREAHLPIPGRLSLITFDDPDWTMIADPPITAVSQPVAEMGRLAVEDLAARIADPGSRPRHRTLGATIVQRASVGPPP